MNQDYIILVTFTSFLYVYSDIKLYELSMFRNKIFVCNFKQFVRVDVDLYFINIQWTESISVHNEISFYIIFWSSDSEYVTTNKIESHILTDFHLSVVIFFGPS